MEPPRDPPVLRWKLMRQDDNGNVVEMRRFDSEEEAHETARVFEERGHKQMYWVERVEIP